MDKIITATGLQQFRVLLDDQFETKNKNNSGPFDGMSKVTLDKNMLTVSGVLKNILTQDMFEKDGLTEGSRVDNENTIFTIDKNFDLNALTITIPNDCILKFDGGSLKNGTIDLNNARIDYSGNSCIFEGITFTGNVYQPIKLDWLMPVRDTDISTKTDVTTYLQSAFNCGARYIDVTSDFYYYITNTVTINAANLDIIGDTNFLSPNAKGASYQPPCIHTDRPINMIDYVVNVYPASMDRRKLNIQGLKLYMDYDGFSNNYYEDYISYQETPLLRIIPGNAGIYSTNINVYICSETKSCKHAIAGSDQYYTVWDLLFTGIEIVPADNHPVTFVHIDGFFRGLFYGVRAHHNNSNSWITDITIDSDSTGLAHIIKSDTGPITINGSHQPKVRWGFDEILNSGFIMLDGDKEKNILINGVFWDLGASTTALIYNAGGSSTGATKKLYNPIYAAYGDGIGKFASKGHYEYFGNPTNFGENPQYSNMLDLLPSIASNSNYFASAWSDIRPSIGEGLFEAVYNSGTSIMDNLGGCYLQVSNLSIKDANDLTYTEDIFSTGSIYCLFANRGIDIDYNRNVLGGTAPCLKAPIASNLTIEFDISGAGPYAKYFYNSLRRGILFAKGTTGNQVEFSVSGDWGDEKINIPGYRGWTKATIYNLLYIKRYLGDIQNLHCKITIDANKTSVPWIGLVSDTYSSAMANGGYIGGVATINLGILKLDDHDYRYLPSSNFHNVSITSDEYVKILELSYYRSSSDGKLVIRYDGIDASICLGISVYTNNANNVVYCKKAKNVSIKWEIYNSDLNSNTRTLVLYAKRAVSGQDVHLFAKSIESNWVISFKNLANDTMFATGETKCLTTGTFDNKPAAADIYVGFKYFCTDRQTAEGLTDGIEIIHKGNNVWVDALGRVIS